MSDQYLGPERRKEDRRKGNNRRQEHRWEPDTVERRHDQGRRKEDRVPNQ